MRTRFPARTLRERLMEVGIFMVVFVSGIVVSIAVSVVLFGLVGPAFAAIPMGITVIGATTTTFKLDSRLTTRILIIGGIVLYFVSCAMYLQVGVDTGMRTYFLSIILFLFGFARAMATGESYS